MVISMIKMMIILTIMMILTIPIRTFFSNIQFSCKALGKATIEK